MFTAGPSNDTRRYSHFERDLAAATADQQRQANTVNESILSRDPLSGTLSRDETEALQERLNKVAAQQRQEEAPTAEGRSDLSNEEYSVGIDGVLNLLADHANQSNSGDDDNQIAAHQDFPEYRSVESRGRSPQRKVQGKTYRSYAEEQALPPPPPPPKPSRIEKRQLLIRKSRAAEAAEKSETILLLQGKTNPTTEDLISIVNELSEFKRKRKLNEKEVKRQARTNKWLSRQKDIPVPRKKVNLVQVEERVGKGRLQAQFTRCTDAANDHALRGREVDELPDEFFTTAYAHGQWLQYDDSVEWQPYEYYHGYFEGLTGRWIGNLTADGKRIYQRDGSIGPAYSGSN